MNVLPYPAARALADASSRRAKAAKVLAVLSDYRSEWTDCDCLEIGCAAGLMTEVFATRFRKVVGLDVDSPGLSAAVRRGPPANVGYVLGDATRLPFPEGAFDVVVCAQVYEHCGNPAALLSESHRVLKPGGLCYFSGPNRLWPIEDHYGLPFVHWLPERVADAYVRLSGRGKAYLEKPMTGHALLGLMAGFVVDDYGPCLLAQPERYLGAPLGALGRAAGLLGGPLAALVPNFNWVLRKLPAGAADNTSSSP